MTIDWGTACASAFSLFSGKLQQERGLMRCQINSHEEEGSVSEFSNTKNQNGEGTSTNTGEKNRQKKKIKKKEEHGLLSNQRSRGEEEKLFTWRVCERIPGMKTRLSACQRP